MPDGSLQRTPLYEAHRAAGARLVPFAGYEMPVQYTGVIEEHRAVRSAAGLFDVSHMGEIRLRGSGALALLQRLTPNDVAALAPGRAHYSGLLTERGTYLDDLLIYRLGADDFLVVVNAANRERDREWIGRHAGDATAGGGGGGEVEISDLSDDYALLALQGPEAERILAPLTEPDVAALRYYGFAEATVGGVPALVSRTGYTGEDGFELYVAPGEARRVWDLLLERGRDRGLVPAGLGARDTLRLEAAMALYGHELDEETTPYEAGLGWVVKLDKGDFIGREALAAQKRDGIRRRLFGFEIEGRGIAREDHPVLVPEGEGGAVGRVTSGSWSPWFEKALGMAYAPPEVAEPGSRLAVEVRGRELPAVVVPLPFYRRPK